jgi:YD repeat-containing protein
LFCPAFNDDDGDCPVTAEARITTHRSDPNSGYLSSITDALNRTEEFTTDKVGRVLTQKLPDGRQIEYEYDQNGNLTKEIGDRPHFFLKQEIPSFAWRSHPTLACCRFTHPTLAYFKEVFLRKRKFIDFQKNGSYFYLLP